MAQIVQYQSPWLHSQSWYDNNLINIFLKLAGIQRKLEYIGDNIIVNNLTTGLEMAEMPVET